jgi:hypothetical protein
MTSFIALYRGETVSAAQLVAVTADPMLVRDFASKLVSDNPGPDEDRRRDLRLVEAGQEDEQA